MSETSKQSVSAGDNELANYLADRDVLCPNCQGNLRGSTANACPSCGSEVTLALLKNASKQPTEMWLWAVRGLSLIAMSIATYLAYKGLTNAHPAGCGAEGGCGEVLGSRWSKLFGVPVSLPATAIYLGMLIASFFVAAKHGTSARRDAWLVLGMFATFAGLGALWFIGLQLFAIKAICPYCMVDHACGLTASLLIFLHAPRKGFQPALISPKGRFATVMSVAVFAAFVGLQLRYPASTFTITRGGLVQNGGVDAKDGVVMKDSTGKDGSSKHPSLIRIESVKDPSDVDTTTHLWLKLPGGPPPNGYVVLPRREFPVLGSYDSENLIVVLVDYTCPHCRLLHNLLHDMLERYGKEQVSFLILPMPLDAQCNHRVRKTEPRHEDACELATTALTIWYADPTLFASFDDWLFSSPDGARTKLEALKKAVQLIGSRRYKEVEADPRVAAQIQRDVALYQLSNTPTNGRIPRLMVRDLVISGPAQGKQLFKLLEENIGVKPIK